MSTAARLFAAILLATAPPALAATGGPARGQSPSAYPSVGTIQQVTRGALVRTLDEQFRAADKNGDGLLSKEELAAAELKKIRQQAASVRATLAAQFSRLDMNHDEQLTKAEFMLAAPELPAVAPDVSADFAQFDRNKDGKVTFGEYESVMLERFDSLDRNHQGKLVQSGGRALSRPEFMKNIQSTFERIDRARDGGFTKAELQDFRMRLERERAAAARQRADSEFAKLDVNRNGRLSRAEFMAAAPAMPANLPDGRSLFAEFDRNRDGRISPEEFLAPFLANFDAIDRNHDQVLSPVELERAPANSH